jgi:hypothetical protein
MPLDDSVLLTLLIMTALCLFFGLLGLAGHAVHWLMRVLSRPVPRRRTRASIDEDFR